MSATAELDPIRPIDRARAAQIVCGQVTRDDEMISAAVQDTFADDWGFGECGSLINVIRALSEDVASLMVAASGEQNAAEFARRYLAQLLAEVDE